MSASMCRLVSYALAVVLAFVAARTATGGDLAAMTALFVLFTLGLGALIPRAICPASESPVAAAPRAIPVEPKPSAPAAGAPPAPTPPAARAPAAEEPKPVIPSPRVAAPSLAPAPKAPEAGHWSAAVPAKSGRAGAASGPAEIRPTAPLRDEATLRAAVGTWRYSAAPEGADDLTRIKGVGPVLAGKLHALGVTRFAEIAAWTEADVARVDEQLNFKGRIHREGWIEQAKALAGA